MLPEMVPTFAPTETLPNAVLGWAERDPGRIFLIEVDGDSRTYGEFHHAALRWADAYRRLGVEPGENVAAMTRTSIAACEHWLGLGWLRAVHTGVNTDFRNDSLVYVLDNCRARHMVCELEFVERVASVASDLHHLETVVVPDAAPADLPTDFPVRILAADQLWEEATIA
ncbi:MAG: AMP-binding protein, partial [Acidimicrobiia bacterium]